MTWQPLSASRSAPSRLRESRDLEIVDDGDEAEAETKAVPVTGGRLESLAPGRSGSLSAPIDCEEYEPPPLASDVIIMIEPFDTESRSESDTSLARPTGINPSERVAPSAREKTLPSLTRSNQQGALPTLEPSGGRKTQQNVAPSLDRTTLPNLKLDAEKYRSLRALILQAVKVCISQGEELGPTGQEAGPSPGETTAGLRGETPSSAGRNSRMCSGDERTKGLSGEQPGTLSGNPGAEHQHPTVPRSVGVGDRRREDHAKPASTTDSTVQRRHPTLRELISGTVPPKKRSFRPGRWRCRSKPDDSSDTDDGDGDESRINVDDNDTDAED